jgi:hypothetical protein
LAAKNKNALNAPPNSNSLIEFSEKSNLVTLEKSSDDSFLDNLSLSKFIDKSSSPKKEVSEVIELDSEFIEELSQHVIEDQAEILQKNQPENK